VIEDGCILDGEIVALDAQGKPSFNLLQHEKGKRAGTRLLDDRSVEI
jgi:ATP-dependent DNA ligase